MKRKTIIPSKRHGNTTEIKKGKTDGQLLFLENPRGFVRKAELEGSSAMACPAFTEIGKGATRRCGESDNVQNWADEQLDVTGMRDVLDRFELKDCHGVLNRVNVAERFRLASELLNLVGLLVKMKRDVVIAEQPDEPVLTFVATERLVVAYRLFFESLGLGIQSEQHRDVTEEALVFPRSGPMLSNVSI